MSGQGWKRRVFSLSGGPLLGPLRSADGLRSPQPRGRRKRSGIWLQGGALRVLVLDTGCGVEAPFERTDVGGSQGEDGGGGRTCKPDSGAWDLVTFEGDAVHLCGLGHQSVQSVGVAISACGPLRLGASR